MLLYSSRATTKKNSVNSLLMVLVGILLFCSKGLLADASAQSSNENRGFVNDGNPGRGRNWNSEEEDIRFLTRAQVYRSKVGDSIQLDCMVDNLGSTVITWYRGERILSAGNLKILAESRFDILTDPRGKGVSVLIRQVAMDDQDNYTCEVNLKDRPMRITHRLEVLVPPHINTVSGRSQGGKIKAQKGSRITLNCSASGHPIPVIHWERQHQKYFSTGRFIERGGTLTLSNVARTDEGVYECVADNQVGEGPVKARVELEVMYPPEVRVEQKWVHSGLGETAQLSCVVYANPDPTVYWKKGSMRLSESERRSTVELGNKNVLTINNLVESDFGNYSCTSINRLGKNDGADTVVILTGAPTRPEISSPSTGQHRYNYHLEWRTKSYFPLLQHRIEYGLAADLLNNGKVQRRPREMLLKSGEVDTKDRGTFSYNIKGLQPQTRYYVTVQTRNEAEWSPKSESFEFTTSHMENFPKELQSRPVEESNPIVPAGSSSSSSASRRFELQNPYSFLKHQPLTFCSMFTLLLLHL